MTTPAELDRLTDVFVTTSRALVGIAVRSIESAPVAVTVPQHRALVLLAAAGAQSVGQIAQQLGVNPSNATRLCDRLQRAGLVARRPSSADGRGVEVLITEPGRQVVAAVTEHRRRELAAILATLPEHDVKTAAQALTVFNQAAHEQADQDWSTHV